METLYFAALACLLAFGALAMIDGFYLHIWKYRLYEHAESTFEHLTHTIRAVLFPAIVACLFLGADVAWSFRLGLLFVVIDVLVLVVDAYSEKDSRAFMGGLPRWEYILHLFANAFHFAAIILFLVLKTSITPDSLTFVPTVASGAFHDAFFWVAQQLIPGSILLAVLHVAVIVPTTRRLFHQAQRKLFPCCSPATL
jgi:hypothetical protein